MSRIILALLALAAAAATPRHANASSLDRPIATTSGLIEGTQDGALHVYKGIPFAAPPVGALRWRAPRPPAPWSGILTAAQTKPACKQKAIGATQPRGAEDCLYLNLWTPALSSSANLPVMVWIFGGGFLGGDASDPRFSGAAFARHGVILVSINYRVGALGFLVHPALTQESPHHTSGNYGILDQIAALRWVHANIRAFGGDPRRITIFGQSAGSTSVSILQASPLAKNLFARAIGQSTSEIDPAAGIPGRRTLREAELAGAQWAASLHATSLAQLRALPADTIVAAPALFWPQENDGYVLPQSVYATFAHGQQNKVDLLVGSNAAEGATLKVPWIHPTAAEQPAYDRLYAAAPDGQVFTDTVEWQMRSWAILQARSGLPTFVYWFDHATPVRPARAPPGTASFGAYHGAEIPYVFGNFAASAHWSDADRKLSQLMMAYWVNFATTGNPNAPGLPPWPRYRAPGTNVMRLSDTPAPEPSPRMDAQAFLDRYFAIRR